MNENVIAFQRTHLERTKLKLDYLLRHMNIQDLRGERERLRFEYLEANNIK